MTTQPSKKPLKESEYTFDIHHHGADTTIAYPPGAENDAYLVTLPYDIKALAPHLSRRTVFHHYNDHHLSYYTKVKRFLTENQQYKNMPLEKFVTITDDSPVVKDAVVNAVLLRNHNVYWQSMKPGGGIQSKKESALTRQIIKSFGSVARFKQKFISKAMKIGIGWIWLFKTNKGLEIIRTEYYLSPVIQSYTPLFTLDVWEHAYYVDYGNMRNKYVDLFLQHLVNWDYAERQFLGS